MLRTRIMAAMTATLLAAGMSLGSAGTAFADVTPSETETDCVVVIWKMPSWVSDTEPTWPQSFVSVHDSDCSTTPIDAALFPVPQTCDTQYQLDKYYNSPKTTALIAGGVLLGYGPEEDLVPGTYGTLARNADCDPPTLPLIGVTATSQGILCDTAGSFTFGPGGGVSPADAARLVWTVEGTNAVGSATAGVPHPVSESATIMVTVRVTQAGYGVSDESGTGDVDPQTGAITYTFEFTTPTDCALETLPTTVAAASFVMPACLGTTGRVVLTNGDGVTWTVNGATVAGNSSHSIAAGSTAIVRASLNEGSGWNDPHQETQWTRAFPAASGCLQTLALTGGGDGMTGLGIAAALLMLAGLGMVGARRLHA